MRIETSKAHPSVDDNAYVGPDAPVRAAEQSSAEESYQCTTSKAAEILSIRLQGMPVGITVRLKTAPVLAAAVAFVGRDEVLRSLAVGTLRFPIKNRLSLGEAPSFK